MEIHHKIKRIKISLTPNKKFIILIIFYFLCRMFALLDLNNSKNITRTDNE